MKEEIRIGSWISGIQTTRKSYPGHSSIIFSGMNILSNPMITITVNGTMPYAWMSLIRIIIFPNFKNCFRILQWRIWTLYICVNMNGMTAQMRHIFIDKPFGKFGVCREAKKLLGDT